MRQTTWTPVYFIGQLFYFISLVRTALDQKVMKQESVRPRWPYDMRPSARAEKYMCVIVIR